MKKFLSAVVALCLVLVMSFSFTASAAANKIVWEEWDIEDDMIYGYSGSDSEIVIPNMDYSRVKIKKIATKAFYEQGGIKKIVISNGVTTLEGACFDSMPDLEEVVFPSSLANLGYGYNICACEKIEKVTLPSALNTVPEGFAALAKGLKEVEFSYGIKIIGGQAFRETALTNVVVPASVEKIESWAFTMLKSDEFTITICNPEVQLTGGKIAGKEYTDDILHNNPNVKITIICPEGSTTEKYYKEHGLPNNKSQLVTKPQSYFDALPENQKDYGIAEVAPVYAPEGMEDVVHDGMKKFDEPASDNSGTTDGNDGAVNNGTVNNGGNNGIANNGGTTVVQGSLIDFEALLLVLGIVFGAIILIIIIVVVIVVIVRAQKKKKKKAARAAELAAATVGTEEVAEPVAEEVFDEPEAPSIDAE